MVPQGNTQGNHPLPHSTAIVRGRAKADADPTIAAALGELLAHDVSAWDGFGLERFKERTVRSVFRGALDGVPVHVKVFRADTLADRARDVLRRPRGAAEAHNLALARSSGIPTVEPLACGIAQDGGQARSFVVTRTASSAVPFMFPATGAVLQRTGALLRTIHDKGVLPADLHPGNLLVLADGSLVLLDLTSVRHGGVPSLPRRAAALAFFCSELDGGARDPMARALLQAYSDAGPPLPATFARELDLATHRWRAHALIAFGRRSSRSCRHTFVPERRRAEPRWFWHLGAGGETDAMRERCVLLLDEPGEPLRRGRRGAVWLTADLAIKERDPGAARRLWRSVYWLTFAKVPIAPPVALCLQRGRGLVFCRRIGDQTLEAEIRTGRLDATAIPTVARSLGASIGRLHAHGLRNRDLKFDNLVRDPKTGEVCMVDLDGVRTGSADDSRGRGADLGRLLAAFRAAGSPGGATTVRTFLRAYLRASRCLLQRPPLRRILLRAEDRAGEWASAHR